ncbi:S1D (Lysyl endopeptidase) subfamily C-terminal domain protein [Burkholderia singularis]|uniref:S1D (Lysyl endopeptidase) subfamily C-terminal domain protein n=1 Tax=Burkholderia singularis TaxID=1503053 RepID=A0A238H5T6_9BURK|nr:S1D (Lysyl endopeptidase) subfamily C-terminal domain protein [Burkholderia singularis]
MGTLIRKLQFPARTRARSRWVGALSLLGGLTFSLTALAGATGYTTLFGGGPIYKNTSNNISELAASGATEIVVWNIAVSSAGDLNFNGEFPLVKNGVYVGNATYPNFANNLAALKQGTVKRITFSIGSSNVGDWQNIKALVQSQGTGPSSILYKDFLAIKQALPSVDAIDFDDENSYDAATTVQFGVMLGSLGYHVMPDPYTNASYWTSVVSQINAQRPGTVDGVHLQTYAGGALNTPCSGWNFGGVPVFPGVADWDDSPPQAQSVMSAWKKQCGIVGAFLWLYDDIAGKSYGGVSTASAYMSAFSAGLAGK